MSVFGYGNSYYGGQAGVQQNPQTNPTYMGSPQAPLSNPFYPGESYGQNNSGNLPNVRTTNMPGTNSVNPYLPGFTQASEPVNPWQSTPSGSAGGVPKLFNDKGIVDWRSVPGKNPDASWGKYTWSNPLEITFGQYANQLMPGSDPNQRRTGGLLPSAKYLGEYGDVLSTPEAGGYTRPLQVGTFSEMNEGLKNLSSDQMYYLDRNADKVSQLFSAASQNYANLFANPNYAAGRGNVREITPYTGPSGFIPGQGFQSSYQREGLDRSAWNQESANKYLGGLYNTIYDQMAKSGLL